MNKRKLRLLNSAIACLGVCAVVFTVSVFAATSANVSVGCVVSFFHTQITATVSMQITDNGIVKTATVGGNKNCHNTSQTIATMVPTDTNNSLSSQAIAITLQTSGTNAFIYEDDYFILSYTITPQETDNKRIIPMYYSITYTPDTGNIFKTLEYSVGESEYASYSTAVTNSAGSAITEATTINFKYKVESTFCAGITSVGVGSFTIKLANSVANLSALV